MLGSLQGAINGVPDELRHVLVAHKLAYPFQRFWRKSDLCLAHVEWWSAHASMVTVSLGFGQSGVLM